MSPRPTLAGELGLFSLFDLAQLFLLSNATGILRVRSGERAGLFQFDRGQISHAVDERLHDGAEAAYRLFGWQAGTFEFHAHGPTGPRTIHDSTDGLMLEAARRLDEAAGDSGGSVTETLQARVGRFEALREAFQRIAAGSGLPSAAAPASGGRFAELVQADDLLLYRPGQAVRASRGGRWRAVTSGPLEPTEFLQLCSSFFDGALPSPGAGRDRLRSVVAYEDQRELLVTHLPAPHDALLIRCLRRTGGVPLALVGQGPDVERVLAIPSGLLLVGAPNLRVADRLLRAVLHERGARRGGIALLVAELHESPGEDGTGALLRATRETLAESLAALAPDFAAFDVAHADASLGALHGVAVVACAVVSPDAAGLLPRWLARHGLTSHGLARVALAGGEIGLLHASGEPTQRGAWGLTALRLRPGAPRQGEAAEAESPDEDATLGMTIERLRHELRDAA